jgi:preprotein translocase subunit SecG
MTFFPFLASVPFVMKIVAAIWMLCCLFLILVVLIQKGKGGGLSATFGGGGAGGVLGSKTGDFLTWFTIALVCMFLILSVVMVKYYKPRVGDYGGGLQQPAPQTQQIPQDQTALPVMPEGDADID